MIKSLNIIILFYLAITFINCSNRQEVISFPNAGYEFNIPEWAEQKLKDKNDFYLSFPIINSAEDKVSFRSFEKSKYSGFENFENWAIKKYKIGQHPDWSIFDRILSIEKNSDFGKLGNSYKTKILSNKDGNEIICCYVLFETNKSYVWINYISNQDTYDKNYGKFVQLVNSIKKTK